MDIGNMFGVYVILFGVYVIRVVGNYNCSRYLGWRGKDKGKCRGGSIVRARALKL
jgi:hypothetical protein